MKNIIVILIIIVTKILLYSVTYTVKQDGTGDFTQIQTAINSSANGDTIIVYPGIYYENINFNGKNIVLTGLYQFTHNKDDITNTIIDGGYNESVIIFNHYETREAYMIGFTIQHGIGHYITNKRYGGGILINKSSPTISNCIIKKNRAFSGGGISIIDSISVTMSFPLFKSLTIFNNFADLYGGGISIANNPIPTFSQDEKCSIFLNYATKASDLYWNGSSEMDNTIVYLDTFTVFNPDNYYFISKYENVELNILHEKIEVINHDLYVSPDGDDNNSGLTPDNPLKSIWYAFTKIKSDSLHPNTIYLKNGLFSPSANGQFFPLAPKSYVSLIGSNRNNTIIDIEDSQNFFYQDIEKLNYKLKNFTLTASNENNSYAIIMQFTNPQRIIIDSLKIDTVNGSGDFCWSILVSKDNNCNILTNMTIQNTIFQSNRGGNLAINSCDSLNLINLKFKDVKPAISGEENGGIALSFAYNTQDYNAVKIINTEITNGEHHQTTYQGALSSIWLSYLYHIYLINSTIASNIITGNNDNYGGAVGTMLGDIGGYTLDIINSIIYANTPYDLSFEQNDGETSIVNISHSLIGNVYFASNIEHNDLGGNLFGANPEFRGEGNYPFALSSTSPCIDAGTLDLPEGIELPNKDLAGNPRVVGSRIDMGAYEYQGSYSEPENLPKIEFTTLDIYPNPFMVNSPRKTELKFDINLIKSGNIKLAIYNLKGQKIYTVMDAYASKGHYISKWDGRDEKGKYVATGMYLLKLEQEGTKAKIKRFTVIK